VDANFDPSNSLQKCSKKPGKKERDSFCNFNDACNHPTTTTKAGRRGCGCEGNYHLACFLRDLKIDGDWGWMCSKDSCQGEKTEEHTGKMRYEYTLKDYQNFFTRSLNEPALLQVWRDQLV
jgi:hypothetical protein